MSNHKEANRVNVPEITVASQVKFGFLCYIGIPDQEKLRERDVCPEDHEGMHQLTHEVIVFQRDDISEVTSLSENSQHQDQQSHRIERASREQVDSPHR